MTDELYAELARRDDAERRMATALVELERSPGHVLLATGTPTGRTAQRWAQAREASARLWQDFATYRAHVAAARGATADPVELAALLHESTVEVGRTVVERRLTGDVEHVRTLTLEQLSVRMEDAFRLVSDVVEECAALHRTFLAGLASPAERLRAARALATELDAGVAEGAALTARVDDLDRACADDPLALAGQPTVEVLAALDADITALASRLAAIAAVRDGWDAGLAEVGAALAELDALVVQEERDRRLAGERVVGPPLRPPPDRRPALRRRLAALTGPLGWPARAQGLDVLRRALAEAHRELTAACELATGLLDRRAELRGRFESYGAKAARLGHAEHPDLLRLDGDIRGLLWSGPADLAAATRALVAYQRVLQQKERARESRSEPGRSA
jgi:hypothetical protein